MTRKKHPQLLPITAALFIVFPALTVVLPTPPANAQTVTKSGGASLSAAGIQAFRLLEKVPYFAVGGVGFAGTTSEGETALRVLLKEKNGPVVMRGLFKNAKPAGKLYALLGLKRAGTPREVAQAADSLRPYKGCVAIRRGYLNTGEPLGALATQIERGEVVLPPECVKLPAK